MVNFWDDMGIFFATVLWVAAMCAGFGWTMYAWHSYDRGGAIFAAVITALIVFLFFGFYDALGRCY